MNSRQVREIQGFLDAFEQLNHGPDHTCTYEFEQVPWAGDLQASLEKHFRGLPGAPAEWSLTLEKVPTGLDGLRPVVAQWLFGECFGGERGMARNVAEATRTGCVDLFVRFLADFFEGEHPKVWRLFARPAGDSEYERVVDEFVLEHHHRVFWLHFGCAD